MANAESVARKMVDSINRTDTSPYRERSLSATD